MEKLALTLESKTTVSDYVLAHHPMAYEKSIMAEIATLIDLGDEKQLAWFAGFGDSFPKILLNVHSYRQGLNFGFTAIDFDQYGWLVRAKMLDREELRFEESEIRLGHGPNGLWAFALSCSYGTAGSSGPLGVFCSAYPDRETALIAALDQLKADLSQYLGNPDTGNYKQELLQKTLKAIAAFQVDRVQLSLF